MEGARRSSRANKGQHSLREFDSYLDESDHETPNAKKPKLDTSTDDGEYLNVNKGQSDSSSSLSEAEDEEDGIPQEKEPKDSKKNIKKKTKDTDTENEGEVKCSPCGANKDNYNEETDKGGMMIQCEACNTWQHAKCMEIDPKRIPKSYKCDICTRKSQDWLDFQSLKDKTRINVAKAFFNVFKTQIPKDYKDDSGLVGDKLATKWAMELEKAIFKAFPGKDRHYADKGRGTMTLIKKPNVLHKIIDGVLSFDKLVSSSPEEIDEDLKQYAEKVRQESIRRSVLTAEENGGQRIRRTHKGEEIVEDVTNEHKGEEMDLNIVTKSIDHRRFESEDSPSKKEKSPSPVSNIGNSDPNSFNYNTAGLEDDDDDDDDVGQIGYDQSDSDSEADKNEPVNDKNSDLDNDEDLAKILGDNGQKQPTKKPVENVKKSALKNSKGHLSSMAPTLIWSGQLTFPDFASFPATSEFVTCTNYKPPETPLDVKFHNQCVNVAKDIFTRKFYDVEGRLDKAKAEPYLDQVLASRDLYLFEIKPTAEHSQYDKLYDYLLQRRKVGVLSGRPPFVKDSYLVPFDSNSRPHYLSSLTNANLTGLFAIYVVKKDYSPGQQHSVQHRPVPPQKPVNPPPASIPQKPPVKNEKPILESILNKLSGSSQTPFANSPLPSQASAYHSHQSNSNNFQQPQELTAEQMGILSGIVQDNPQVQNNPQALMHLLQQQQQQQQHQQHRFNNRY